MFFRDKFGFLADLYDFKLAQNNLLQMALWLGSTLPVAVSCGKAAWMALDVFLGDFLADKIIASSKHLVMHFDCPFGFSQPSLPVDLKLLTDLATDVRVNFNLVAI